ncbi:MAG: N-acyl-D-amino-acid deacylase family protein [Aminivibrio sp.]|jgi:N-acyl-D-amino-acid deacylase
MFDAVIRGAMVADGTGRDLFRADVAIKDGRIASIGTDLGGAAEIIDGTGQVLSPGFIDMHTHMDLELLREKKPDAKIRQGVTTDLIGQDGLGAAPVSPRNRKLLADILSGLNGVIDDEKWSWSSFGEYLNVLDGAGLPNNVAALISQGPVRIEAMGMDERPPTDRELDVQRALVREAMEEGAFGLSSGLIYPPCPYADESELTEINREVAAFDGIFVVHQRDEGYYLSRSFDEVCEISRRSGARLHVSHLQAYGQVNWPIMDEVLAKADAFLEEGGKVTWDRYPYLAGCTTLTAVLPTWTFNEGTDALIANLTDPAYRKKIHDDFALGLDVWHNRQISVGWENIIVTAVRLDRNKWMEGLSCQAIADRQGKNPVDAVCDLLAEEKLAVTMISFYGSEDVLRNVLSHPCATVGSDGIYGGRPHPRLFGSYPKYLREYVRENKTFTLEEAVRKITSFPAEILGIPDRGVIKESVWADLVLFDPEKIGDRATYEEPEQYPEGISYVFVNGVEVVNPEGTSGTLPGRVLRKGKRQ